ncbi:MAG: hypothetical protein QXF45_05210 [Candidatus Caldarchaeum sp.]
MNVDVEPFHLFPERFRSLFSGLFQSFQLSPAITALSGSGGLQTKYLDQKAEHALKVVKDIIGFKRYKLEINFEG